MLLLYYNNNIIELVQGQKIRRKNKAKCFSIGLTVN